MFTDRKDLNRVGLSPLGQMRSVTRSGVTIAEVLVVCGILGILVALLLPAVQGARERSRQAACQNNLRQLMVATTGYEAARGEFPVTATSSGDIVNGKFTGISLALSPQRSLVAFIDPAIFGKLDFNDVSTSMDNAVPSSLSAANSALIGVAIPIFLCPSDDMPAGGNNYRANMGTGPGIYSQAEFPLLGPFDPGNRTGAWINGNALRPQQFLDGLSNTIMYSEKVIGDRNPAIYTPFRDRFASPVLIESAAAALQVCHDFASPKPAQHDSYSGTTWLFGGWNNTWYSHIATPNSRIPDCSVMGVLGGGEGLYTARSFHSGGVNAAFGDGAVKFISESIDLAVWRALSTRAGGEPIPD